MGSMVVPHSRVIKGLSLEEVAGLIVLTFD
jgi:hypothetical protein